MQNRCARKLSFPIFTAVLLWASVAHGQNAEERAAQAGELLTLKGHRVLRLFGGSIRERGFAHGYLLAEEIRRDIDGAITSLPFFNTNKFEQRLLPFSAKFKWDASAAAELDGIYEGMKAKLGESGMGSKPLGRPLTRDDLAAVNVVADYFGPACSGFCAWGARTKDGKVLHGRTLDFPVGAVAVADQVIIASEALPEIDQQPAAKAWMAIGWPGLIVQYTGMNSDGVVVCIHDAYNLEKSGRPQNCTPRGLLLRRILEQTGAESDPAADAAKIVGDHPVACGNLFHMSWPAGKKEGLQPSAVIEIDPSKTAPDIRRPDEANALVLTNHFCVRCAPCPCERFAAIEKGLGVLQQNSLPIGISEARKLLISAEEPIAAHSVYFLPESLEFHLALTRNNIMSPHVMPTAFTFKELFRKQ